MQALPDWEEKPQGSCFSAEQISMSPTFGAGDLCSSPHLVAMCLSSGCCDTLLYTGWRDRNFFLTVLEAGKSETRVPAQSDSEESPLPGFQACMLFLYPHAAESREKAWTLPTPLSCWSHHESSAFTTSFPPKDPICRYHRTGDAMNLGTKGWKHAVHKHCARGGFFLLTAQAQVWQTTATSPNTALVNWAPPALFFFLSPECHTKSIHRTGSSRGWGNWRKPEI